MFELALSRGLSSRLQGLQAMGLDLHVPENYSDVPNLVASTGRQKQTPMLSVARNDFTHQDAFYLYLRRLEDGRIMGGCAATHYDLGVERFEDFVRRTSQQQYGRESDPIERVARSVAGAFRGHLVYLGELELHPDMRGNHKALGLLTQSLMGLAAMKWPGFSWMYGFLPDAHVKLAHRYGFRWLCEGAITWRDPVPDGRRNDHWIAAISADQFRDAWLVDQ